MHVNIITLCFLYTVNNVAELLAKAVTVNEQRPLASVSNIQAFRSFLFQKRRAPQQLGELCVDNEECKSKCCIYSNSIAGSCVDQAPIGQVCGFVRNDMVVTQSYYRQCTTCDTNCCCGKSCCPTSYCVTVLELTPEVCTTCNTGCCCYPTPEVLNATAAGVEMNVCCHVTYCAASSGLVSVQGTACLRCQSGCCCGPTEDPVCCLSSFCKGSAIGTHCERCFSGCCCGTLCCAYSFCDSSVLSLTRLLTLYSGLSSEKMRELSMPSQSLLIGVPMETAGVEDPNLMRFGPIPMSLDGDGGSMMPFGPSPMPMDLNTNYFGYFGHPISTLNTQGRRCIGCTTGCCCDFGCCSIAYCPTEEQLDDAMSFAQSGMQFSQNGMQWYG